MWISICPATSSSDGQRNVNYNGVANANLLDVHGNWRRGKPEALRVEAYLCNLKGA